MKSLKPLLSSISTFYSLAFPFLLFILGNRLIESVAYFFTHQVPSDFIQLELTGSLYDIFTTITITGFLLIPCVLISSVNQRAGKTVQIILQAFFILLSLLLSVYFVISTEPLDHVIFTYSVADLSFAGKASGGANWWQITGILLFMICFLVLSFRIKTKNINRYLLFSLIIISLSSILFIKHAWYSNEKDETKEGYVNNRLTYFLSSCYTYFNKNETISTTNKNVFLNQNSGKFIFLDKNYPLLHKENTPDVLGSFFNIDKTKRPNIVFIIVESLSRSVVGDDAKLGNFTPFLDSLSKKSLYWPNFLSTADRTFNVLPSSLGSLPYSKNGFMDIGDSAKFAEHYTSLQLLHNSGYYTRFYVGCWPHFNNMDGFMNKQNINYIVYDWPDKYVQINKDKNGFTWGYSDEAIYKRSFDDADQLQSTNPRFDVMLTITSHAPFICPNQSYYDDLAMQQIHKMNLSKDQEEEYLKDLPKYSTIMYSDNALRNYLKEYQKRDDFKNTIFFIYGDHAMPELDSKKSSIEKYNVPLIIYSPMLKKGQRFEAISTQLNLTPSLLAFLHSNYDMIFPRKVSWLAGALDTSRNFRNLQVLPFMRSNRDIDDYLNRDYFISKNQLYKLESNLKIVPVQNPAKWNELKNQLQSFIDLNRMVCEENKIIPALPSDTSAIK